MWRCVYLNFILFKSKVTKKNFLVITLFLPAVVFAEVPSNALAEVVVVVAPLTTLAEAVILAAEPPNTLAVVVLELTPPNNPV